MEANRILQNGDGNESFIMSLLLCKSSFIRDINLEARALIDERCTKKQNII